MVKGRLQMGFKRWIGRRLDLTDWTLGGEFMKENLLDGGRGKGERR